MYYLGELVRKPCARQEVLGSNPVVCKFFFNIRHLLSRFCHPGQKPFVPVPKPGQKTVWNRDKSCSALSPAANQRKPAAASGRIRCDGVMFTTTDSAFCPGSKLAFVPVLKPEQGFRDKSLSSLLSRVEEPGQKVPDVKIFRHTTGFDLKTFCLAHGFLTNSPK